MTSALTETVRPALPDRSRCFRLTSAHTRVQVLSVSRTEPELHAPDPLAMLRAIRRHELECLSRGVAPGSNSGSYVNEGGRIFPVVTPASGIELPQGMRRIVTGHDAEGKSDVVSDERVTGFAVPNLFKTSGDDPYGPGPEGEPRELRATDSPRLEPEVGGASFVFVTLPPTLPDAEVWHRTETVDINVLLGGELILVLEKEEVTLHPGDAVIQRNTMHAWKNRTNAPVYWVAVLVPIRQRG